MISLFRFCSIAGVGKCSELRTPGAGVGENNAQVCCNVVAYIGAQMVRLPSPRLSGQFFGP